MAFSPVAEEEAGVSFCSSVSRAVKEVLRVFDEARGLQLAAACSFFVLLAVGPVAVLLLSIAGFFFGDDAARGRVFAALHELLGAGAAAFIEDVVQRSAGRGSGVAALLGVLLLFWTASGVFSQLADAFAVVRRVAAGGRPVLPEPAVTATKWQKLLRSSWGFLRERLLSAVGVFGAALLLALSLLASSVLAMMTARFDVSLLVAPANLAVSFAVFAFASAMLLRLLGALSSRSALVGGAAAAAVFLVGRALFARVVMLAASESSFGPAASAIAVLLWTWFSAAALLLGCAVAAVHDEARARKPGRVSARGKRSHHASSST